jgi:AcrR family transcriptional regulator
MLTPRMPDPPGFTTEGRRTRRKRATRESLIRAGRALFGERGLYESRIEDLTHSAGIAKGTLYTYFADKDALIEAVFEEGLAELATRMTRRIRGATELDVVARRAMAAHVEFLGDNPDLMRIFLQVRGMLQYEHSLGRPLRILLEGHLVRLAGTLALAPRVAALPRAARLDVARIAYGTVSGVCSVNAALGARRPSPGSTRNLLDALVHVVLARVESVETRSRRGSR